MGRFIEVSTSVMASTVRAWHGTSSSRSARTPDQLLELFDREACPKCRLVREALTELNLDAMVYPVPNNGRRFIEKLVALSGQHEVPFLHDPNTGKKLNGVDEIVEYLFKEYRGKAAPNYLSDSTRAMVASNLSTVVRRNAGKTAKKSIEPETPLTLYSFESSPFSRLVRERLCELELPYHLVNLGKQQRSEMGPAKFRMSLGKYTPLPNTKRAAFFAEHGNVQVPYLVDPNTDTAMFESADILMYLDANYETV